jgi:NADH-quinone oxidoreductase subunit E
MVVIKEYTEVFSLSASENCTACAGHETLYHELDVFIDANSQRPGVLIEVLHKAQELFGYLSPEVQSYIAKKLNVPESTVYGVVTFYHYFTMEPRGQNQIKVCLGTACYVKGSESVMNRLKEELKVATDEVTPDGKFSIHEVRCLGACSMAPVVLIGEKDFYGRVTPDEVPKILKKYRG